MTDAICRRLPNNSYNEAKRKVSHFYIVSVIVDRIPKFENESLPRLYKNTSVMTIYYEESIGNRWIIRSYPRQALINEESIGSSRIRLAKYSVIVYE